VKVKCDLAELIRITDRFNAKGFGEKIDCTF
jgi:hypothetical protein